MRWLIDTNVLVRLRDQQSAHFSACVQAIAKLRAHGDVLCVCTQVAIEYFVVATRPVEVNGIGLSCEQAIPDVRDFRRLFLWLPEPPDIINAWEQTVVKYGITGKQAHDARLIALMLAHGVEGILTLNTVHFQRYHEVRAESPYQLVNESEYHHDPS